MRNLKPLVPLFRCSLHNYLVIPGRGCTVCADERAKGMAPGTIGGLRGERVEVQNDGREITVARTIGDDEEAAA